VANGPNIFQMLLVILFIKVLASIRDVVIGVCRCKQRRTRLFLLCVVLCIICILALVLGIGIPFGLMLNKGAVNEY